MGRSSTSGCFAVDGPSSNLLLLLLGVAGFFALGVWDDATNFEVILVPLVVFFFSHVT